MLYLPINVIFYNGLVTMQQLATVMDIAILKTIHSPEHQRLQTLTVLIIHHLNGQMWFTTLIKVKNVKLA